MGVPVLPVVSISTYDAFAGPADKIVKSWAFFKSLDPKTLKSISIYDVHKSFLLKSISIYDVHSAKVLLSPSKMRVFTQTRRVIYATNTITEVTTLLGELLPGQTTLADVALADGQYVIEVRSSENYWDETQSRIRFPVEILTGVVEAVGIPPINVLISTITRAFSTKLFWEIPDAAFIEGMTFGIWVSATSPVDVSGAPDFTTVAYDGLGQYSFITQQTVDKYYAVAAIAGTEQGSEREVFQPWDLTAPTSPDQQYGFDREEK